jgi:hypothetical protein
VVNILNEVDNANANKYNRITQDGGSRPQGAQTR